MDHHFEDGRLFLDREPEETKRLVQRLNRIEGQVRGIRGMIEGGRHCRDELQQISAVIAALKEVAVVVASQHIGAGAASVVAGHEPEAALADLYDVLQAAIRAR